MQGFNVLHPMGWDAFGQPAENEAIKRQRQPSGMVREFADNYKRQMQLIGLGYDWDSEVNSSDPDVLPLDTVAVFAAPQARVGVPQRRAGQLGPRGQDRARQRRSGQWPRLALRGTWSRNAIFRSGISRSHRMPTACWPGWTAWTGPTASKISSATGSGAGRGGSPFSCCHRPKMPRRSPSLPPGPTPCGARPFWCWPRSIPLVNVIATPAQKTAIDDLQRARAASDRHRPSGRRARKDRRSDRCFCRQSRQRQADPHLGRRLCADGLWHRSDHGRARPRPARL